MTIRLLIALVLCLCTPSPSAQNLPATDFAYGAIALLQPDAEISGRVAGDVDGLTDYMKALFAVFESEAKAHPQSKGTSGVLVVVVRPNGRAKVWLEFGENPEPRDAMERIKHKLESVPPVRVFGRPISFLVNFDLWGGGKSLTSPENPVYAPEEWRRALKDSEGPVDLETLIDRVWPENSE